MLKQVTIFFALIFFFNNLNAQNTIIEPSQSPTAPYRLFKTNNIWTFIKLDTATGKMWQIQFDVKEDNRGSVVLNSQDLTNGKEKKTRTIYFISYIKYVYLYFSRSNRWSYLASSMGS